MPQASQPGLLKRLRYFDGQFLQVGDFSDEQSYHRGLRQLLSQGLLTGGVVDGLVPAIKNGRLEISPGLAVDAEGREVVVAAALSHDPPSAGGIYLQYHEEAADPATAGNIAEETRWVQQPQVTVGAPPAAGICIGRITSTSPLQLSAESREVAKMKLELTGSQSAIVELRSGVDANKRDLALLTRQIGDLAARIPPPGPQQPQLGLEPRYAFIRSLSLPLAINPEGQNVGIGTFEPKSALAVAGGLAVGTSFAGAKAAGANALIVEGKAGIGTASPRAALDVIGTEDPLAIFDHTGAAGNAALYLQQDGQMKTSLWWDQTQRNFNLSTASKASALTVQDDGMLEVPKGIKATGRPVIVDIAFQSFDKAQPTGYRGGGWYWVGDIFAGRGKSFGYIKFRVADGSW